MRSLTFSQNPARIAVILLLLVLAIDLFRSDPAEAAQEVATDHDTAVRAITFPIVGATWYQDRFLACRGTNCERRHMGQDLMSAKLTKLVAARAGTVAWLREDATPDGTRGNGLDLRDSDGWTYRYLHVNNDTPGTDDGANPAQWRFAPGVYPGAKVVAGQLLGYVGDSGNAEWTDPHLHFEIHKPDGSVINPYDSLQQGTRLTEPTPRFVGVDTPGVVEAGQWELRNANSAGTPDVVIGGLGATASARFGGDWNGDGIDTPGYVVGNTFFLHHTNDPAGPKTTLGYGKPGDRPVVGDWNGDGIDTVGVRRNNVFYLRNANTTGVADVTLGYGVHTDIPVVGDWDGNGTDTFGVRRGDRFLLRNANTTGVAQIDFVYGAPSAAPVIGDWDGR